MKLLGVSHSLLRKQNAGASKSFGEYQSVIMAW